MFKCLNRGDGYINNKEDIIKIEEEFKRCHKLFNAIGDETRQQILCAMMEGDCYGSRVIDLTSKVNLSRPAISHHMQILKDARLVKSRKEGTYIYYYLEPDQSEIKKMIGLCNSIIEIASKAPDRKEE